MYQPQNPRNDKQQPPQQPGQPYPQQPPLYPEVKPLPKGWQQPIPPESPYHNQPPQQQYYQPQPGYYQQPQQPQAVKQWPWWATMILVFGVVIVIVAVAQNANKSTSNQQQVIATAAPAGSGQGAPAPATAIPTSKIGKVGETIALNGYTLTVNGVDKSDNFSSGPVTQAKPGNTFVAVDLTIGSQKNSGVSANGLYASIKDSQGFKYNVTIFGTKDPSLAGTNDIPSGDKVRGWVTFEVPKTATGLVLEYGQMFDSEKIRVALG